MLTVVVVAIEDLDHYEGEAGGLAYTTLAKGDDDDAGGEAGELGLAVPLEGGGGLGFRGDEGRMGVGRNTELEAVVVPKRMWREGIRKGREGEEEDEDESRKKRSTVVVPISFFFFLLI